MTIFQQYDKCVLNTELENIEVSIYNFDNRQVTKKQLEVKFNHLKIAFPTANDDFMKLVFARFKENNYKAARLYDAINNVIDTYAYPNLNVSAFLQFDKRVKFYTKEQVYRLFEGKFQDFEWLDIDESKLPDNSHIFVHKNDVALFKIPIKDKKKVK